MARNFNRPVPGLLGYLDQKSDGRNPQYLVEATQPVLQLDAWLQQNAEWMMGPLDSVTTAAYWLANEIVPEGQRWLLFNMAAELGAANALPASALLGVALVHWTPNLGMRTFISPWQYLYVGGGTGAPQASACVGFRAEPIILGPGERVGAWMRINGGAYGETMRLSYRKLVFPT